MELRDRLQGPKTRFRERSKVDAAVQEILEKYDVESLLPVDVLEQDKPTFRQASKGRPGKDTKYVKKVKFCAPTNVSRSSRSVSRN